MWTHRPNYSLCEYIIDVQLLLEQYLLERLLDVHGALEHADDTSGETSVRAGLLGEGTTEDVVGELPAVGGVSKVAEAGDEAEVAPHDLSAVLVELAGGEGGLVLVVGLEKGLVVHDLDEETEELGPPESKHSDLADHAVLGEDVGELDAVEDDDVVEDDEDAAEEVGEVLSDVLLGAPGVLRDLVEDVEPSTEDGELAGGVDGAGSKAQVLGKGRLGVVLRELDRSKLCEVLKGLVEVRTSGLIVGATNEEVDTGGEGVSSSHLRGRKGGTLKMMRETI